MSPGSSHPPRKTVKKSKSPSAKPQGEEKLQLIAEEPLAQAWNDLITVLNFGKKHNLQIAALYTPLHSVVRGPGEEDSDGGSSRSAPLGFDPYEIPEVQPSVGDNDFQMQARALVHLSNPPPGHVDDGSQGMQVDGFFLFLFEVSAIPEVEQTVDLPEPAQQLARIWDALVERPQPD